MGMILIGFFNRHEDAKRKDVCNYGKETLDKHFLKVKY